MFAGFVEQVNQLARARPAANALIAFLSLGFGEDLRYEGLMSMTWRNLSTVAASRDPPPSMLFVPTRLDSTGLPLSAADHRADPRRY